MDRTEPVPKPLLRERTQPALPRYARAYYSDGPKVRELKSYDEIAKLLDEARPLLDKTKLGISVLATEHENFDDLRTRCKKADFFELNLKYSMRSKQQGESFFATRAQKWAETITIIERFLKAFAGMPVFVKLSRELEWLPSTQEATNLINLLKSHGEAGLVVANSRKVDIGGFIHDDEELKLEGGVLCGDPLYDSTLAMISGLAKTCKSAGIPIVASGGMVDEQQVLMAIRAGAVAVQLCTAFDYNGSVFYQTLVFALTSRMRWRGVKDMGTFVEQLRNEEGVASIFSIPIGYSSSFWADEFQKKIRQDIRLSRRMDFLIISGKTLYEKWTDLLDDRVKCRFLSVRALHLNPDSDAFNVVQQTWGYAEPNASQAQAHRLRSAKDWLENLFVDGRKALIQHLKGNGSLSPRLQDVLANPDGFNLLTEIRKENSDRQRDDQELLPCPEWGADVYSKCPFYSMYIFDDKAHVAMYPFIAPGDASSPVYTYPRSSREYERLSSEFDKLWRYSKRNGPVLHVGSNPDPPSTLGGTTE